MSAFNIALSGLTAASTDLDVVSNNVANADTTGFKSSRAEFADVYAAGAVNLNQSSVGQGVRVASVAATSPRRARIWIWPSTAMDSSRSRMRTALCIRATANSRRI
jgi:flagellar basal body rod protein FlgG